MSRHLLLLCLLLCAAKLAQSSFSVCGNYCGPGWCNGGWIPEANCDESVSPETWPLSGASCADKCCRTHDYCCAKGVRSSCNPAIVACLGACDPLSTTCTNSGVPVPPPAIEVAMWFITQVGYCCGGACSAAEYVSLERDLIASNASHAHSWLPAIRRAAAEQRAREERGDTEIEGEPQRRETQQEAEERVRRALASTAVPPLSTKFLVTKSEYTDKACEPGTSLFSFQYEAATCKLVNATVGGGPVALMHSRIACTDDDAAPVPVTVYYSADDAACASTPLGVATATFPAGCHENSAISCLPRQTDYLFRSSIWFNSAHCEAAPVGFYYAAQALAGTPCFATPSGSVAATCAANGTALATVSMFLDSACQMPIPGGEQRLPLGACEVPPPGSLHLAGSVLTECMP